MDGQVLSTLVRAANARRAVEIGTLGGYSALWIARALQPGGMLDCFELDVERAQFALEHVTRACPPITLSVYIGPALEHLDKVLKPVDFVFIDADKENYPNYLEWAARSLRQGGIVAMDNAFAWGHLREPDRAPRPAEARAIREAVDNLATDKRFHASMIPTNEGLAVGVRL
jgi:predicted O-methyltransferase YrrM